MDFKRAKQGIRVHSFPFSEELDHVKKAKYLPTTQHPCPWQNPETQAQSDGEDTESPQPSTGFMDRPGLGLLFHRDEKLLFDLCGRKNSTKLSKQRILAPMSSCFRKEHLAHKIIPLYTPIARFVTQHKAVLSLETTEEWPTGNLLLRGKHFCKLL